MCVSAQGLRTWVPAGVLAAALSAEFGKHIGQETRRMSVGPGQRRRAGSRTKYTEEQ